MRRDSLTLLYGQSGLGKSSLLRAGLFPRLRDEGLLPVYIRLDFRNRALGFLPVFAPRLLGSLIIDPAILDPAYRGPLVPQE